MKLRMELHGFKDLEKQLKKLPDKVGNKVLQSSVRGAMKIGLKAVKDAAPRNDGLISEVSQQYGPLHKNIKLQTIRGAKKRGGRGIRLSTTMAFWGYFYEKGTRYQPARPWLEPAFLAVVDNIMSDLKDRIGKGIEKEAQRKV